jgi:hypothetical protein
LSNLSRQLRFLYVCLDASYLDSRPE